MYINGWGLPLIQMVLANTGIKLTIRPREVPQTSPTCHPWCDLKLRADIFWHTISLLQAINELAGQEYLHERLEQCFPYIFWNSVCRFAPSIHMDHSQKFGYYTAGCPKGCCCCLYNCWILVDTTHRQYRISMRARQLQPTGIFKTCKFIWNLSLHNATTCP